MTTTPVTKQKLEAHWDDMSLIATVDNMVVNLLERNPKSVQSANAHGIKMADLLNATLINKVKQRADTQHRSLGGNTRAKLRAKLDAKHLITTSNLS